MKIIILFGLMLGALSAPGKVYIGEVGGKVTLQCGVNSFKDRVVWTHNVLIFRFEKSGLIHRGSSKITSRAKKSGQTNMEISNIEESDSGEFTCTADSSVLKHHLVVVSVSVVPSGPLKVGTDATLECKTNSGASGQVIPEVKWQKPDGSVQTKSKVELKPFTSSDKGTWLCLVFYRGEKFNKTINVEELVPQPTTTTIFENPKTSNSGNGKNSTGGVKVSEDPMLLLGLVWWIWVAIGAGGLVVIILIIVIIVMHKRNQRKKKKFLRLKKAQLSQKPKKYCQCVRQTAAAKPKQGRRREKPSALPLQPLLQE